jgi:L-fuculose-phosphate aldolase
VTRDTETDARIGDLIEIGHRLWRRGLVAANDGNLSVRLDDARVLMTVTGSMKGHLGRNDFVVVDRRGDVVEGDRRPSSEMRMHLAIYDVRPEVRAVVHAHPPIATGFAVARRPIAADVLSETVILGPVPVVPYATPSTDEVPRVLRPHVATGNACLLANHGAVTWASEPFEAYYHMERLESVATILSTAERLGGAVPLTADEIERLHRTVASNSD